MPDQNELIPPAENPVANPPGTATSNANDNPGISSPTPETGRLQKIREIAGKIGAKFKPGRGRPRKDGQPKVSDVVVTASGEAVTATEKPALAAVAQLDAPSPSQARLHKNIARTGKAVIGGAVDALKWYNGNDGFKPEFLNPLLDRARPDDELLSDWSEDTQALLTKYQVNVEHTEEANFIMSSSRILGGFVMVLREIRAEKARRASGAKGVKS